MDTAGRPRPAAGAVGWFPSTRAALLFGAVWLLLVALLGLQVRRPVRIELTTDTLRVKRGAGRWRTLRLGDVTSAHVEPRKVLAPKARFGGMGVGSLSLSRHPSQASFHNGIGLVLRTPTQRIAFTSIDPKPLLRGLAKGIPPGSQAGKGWEMAETRLRQQPPEAS